MANVKPKYGDFSVRGLHKLEKQLQQNPALMEGDWLEIFRQSFGMTETQRAVLDSIPKKGYTIIQKHFADAAKRVRAGGIVRLRVVYEDETTRALYLMSVPKTEIITKPIAIPALIGIKIICCDANCRDWHWCWSRNKPPTKRQ